MGWTLEDAKAALRTAMANALAEQKLGDRVKAKLLEDGVGDTLLEQAITGDRE